MSFESRPKLLVNDATDNPTSELAPSLTSPHEDDPWRRKVLLSFDGGGVRGLSSLKILGYLMTSIQIEEKRRNKNKNASGSTHSPLFDSASPKESSMPDGAESNSCKYLPCHYFDFIGGTCTGGLIAIMLGRLRMSVDEAIEEYKELCKDVFEKPSSKIGRLFNKYDTVARRQKLKDHFESMASRHLQPTSSEETPTFKSDLGRCRTIVCTVKKTEGNVFAEHFLFKSYESSKDCKRKTEDSNADLKQHPSDSHTFGIREVAALTTMAPSFFEFVDFENSQYYDAIVNLNNPTWTLLNEVSSVTAESREKLDIVVSIGAGEPISHEYKPGAHGIAFLAHSTTNSEYVDQIVRKESGQQEFRYERLDLKGGLQNVRIDEWKPKKSGAVTFEKVEAQTAGYLVSGDGDTLCWKIAKILVKRRIERSKTMQWEAFASGIRYKCPLPECSKGDVVFAHRNALMDHLRMKHDKPPPDTEHYREMKALLDQGRTYYD